MKGYLVDVYGNGDARVVELEATLEDYYKLLQCDCIDIAERQIDGVYFDVVCDDEGLLVDLPKISATDTDGSPMMCGNLLFLHDDGKGHEIGLSDKDINILKMHTRKVSTRCYPEPYSIITDMYF